MSECAEERGGGVCGATHRDNFAPCRIPLTHLPLPTGESELVKKMEKKETVKIN